MDSTYGRCKCGCGELTTVSPETDRRFGYIKGVPRVWKRGHMTGMDQVWLEVDTGYATICHIWQGGRSGRYGWARTRDGLKATFAHLMAWRIANGKVPNGKQLHHLCGEPLCVRLDHLAIKTHSEHASLHRGQSGRISKLSKEDVEDIRTSGMKLSLIVSKYGISKSHACRVRKNGIKTRHRT